MTFTSATRLTDHELIDATTHAVRQECRSTAELLSLLAELDTRRLYLKQGCSSLFTYCTQVFHLSEPAAYSRITAARAVRTFPNLLDRLADGDITLTTITVLASHLTPENFDPLLDAARHKTKRDVEQLIANLYSQPDVPTMVRRVANEVPAAPRPGSVASPPVATSSLKPAAAPVAADRYLLRVTIDGAAHANLQRARDLLRHSMPSADPAAVIGLALTAFVEQLEKKKAATTSRPRDGKKRFETQATTRGSRHIPATVRREAWKRDGARCAFVGPQGRCSETGFLEFHHVRPFADGGRPDVGNIELRCRAHNQHEADVYFGQLT